MEDTELRSHLICMVGTDHGIASVDVRSRFSLPADARDAALPVARVSLGASGVAFLATCNRTELWVSFDGCQAPERHINPDGTPQEDDPVFAALCAMHNVDPQSCSSHFVCREGDEAVAHLFNVACGLRSAIVAEDQIVSQVKQSIATARELGVADSCLEVLFRQAVTAAKQVKSGVRFTRAYATAIDQALDLLVDQGVDLGESTCMVIGNGEYGRLAASSLVQRGATVMVTVRQYTHGTVSIPQGCEGIPYAERYEHLGACNIVMSATTSPHFTLEAQKLAEALGEDGHVTLFDLAIPRDIDPRAADLPNCELHDIDSFTTQVGVENKQAIESAQRLLAAGMDDFWSWVHRRDSLAQSAPPTGAFFPLFMDLGEWRAVFVGGGAIALRRVRTLLPFVGDITVFAPEFSPELERFAADGAITLVRRTYEPEVLDGANVVFACTNSPEINDAVWEECKRRGTLVNVCSDRFKCDFHFPGVVQRGNVVIGVNAGGKEHRRVKQLRARIDRLMDEEDV